MPEPEKKEEKKEEPKKETEVPKDSKGTPTVQNSEKKEPEDPLLQDLDTEYKEKLGDEVYKDYANYPLKERVKMLRAIAKGIDKAKGIKTQEQEPKPEAKNPAAPPANSKSKPKTLLEMNDKDTFFEKMQNQTSFANKAQSWLK